MESDPDLPEEEELAKMLLAFSGLDEGSLRRGFWRDYRMLHEMTREQRRLAEVLWEKILLLTQQEGMTVTDFIASLEPWQQEVMRDVIEKGNSK